jgi:hypothetical protein
MTAGEENNPLNPQADVTELNIKEMTYSLSSEDKKSNRSVPAVVPLVSFNPTR